MSTFLKPYDMESGMRHVTSMVAVLACLTACGPKHVDSETPEPKIGVASDGVAEFEGVSSPAFNVSMTVMRKEPADTVAVSPLAAWRALRGAYASVGLKVYAVDSASRSVASPMMRVHQFLGGQSLSRYLECGQTAFGDVAATQEIVLRVRSTVESGPDGTALVRTLVRAVATPQGSDQFRCGSTRRLERRIVEYIEGRTGDRGQGTAADTADTRGYR